MLTNSGHCLTNPSDAKWLEEEYNLFSKDVEENEAHDIKTEVEDSAIIGNKWTVEDKACVMKKLKRIKHVHYRIWREWRKFNMDDIRARFVEK